MSINFNNMLDDINDCNKDQLLQKIQTLNKEAENYKSDDVMVRHITKVKSEIQRVLNSMDGIIQKEIIKEDDNYTYYKVYNKDNSKWYIEMIPTDPNSTLFCKSDEYDSYDELINEFENSDNFNFYLIPKI